MVPGTLITPPIDTVFDNVCKIVPDLSDIGFDINPSKSEMIVPEDDNFIKVVNRFESVLSSVRTTEREKLVILGSQFTNCAFM